MYRSAQARLTRLLDAAGPVAVRGCLKGLEREALRVAPDGRIAQTRHPRALGAALTHPWITTDYSEALLEFITPPVADTQDCTRFLDEVHRFVLPRLGDEKIWPGSMPCVVDGEDGIPIAEYGSSNAGYMKHVYRRGLGYRYGKLMQVIAGVHFNFSLPEAFWAALREIDGSIAAQPAYVSDGYFRLTRNVQRVGWLVPYLFGASPAVCRSFIGARGEDLDEWDDGTLYLPYATSLRMSGIGYQNRKEKKCGVHVRYDGLDAYVASLARAVNTPCPEYEAIGVCRAGDWRQLSGNILQIENEYYSTVRPKQPPLGNEKVTAALARRGVRYVELRSLDVDPYQPTGVDAVTLRFVEALLIFCTLADSPRIELQEQLDVNANLERVARAGRDPGLLLARRGASIGLRDWGLGILAALEPVCAVLDGADPESPYTAALNEQRGKLEDPARTPSARVLAEMGEREEGFFDFGWRLAAEHAATLRRRPLRPAREAEFRVLAERSHAEQAAMEAADDIGFEEYLRRYFAQR
ncbi:glutamate--cysteine ligase [Plasticicumulans sp.]|uniref:glutamate--cysteine ligase n=1 Tax=Plasticicumulans sp. TaxID=2307179 RepID=UPI000FA49A1A|nr:glutamate--cysteine ligase [Plasticicumulans sp.]RTK98956.1 MAG: glutamate--cysteine ligase [Xanthomonadales bacterium]HMZ11342.1 glutamate--cysteine ligase [Plasticicumulans sp.]HNM43570.1 glutamate--cysteine ligase [Plasticicumulans sp.]HNO60642.1 glutamate--cysteine ligase [Plasticicumulans sp.]